MEESNDAKRGYKYSSLLKFPSSVGMDVAKLLLSSFLFCLIYCCYRKETK